MKELAQAYRNIGL